MGITKIIYNNDTLMDNTTVSVLPTAMLINVTALQNNGIDISGTISNQTADNIIMNSTNINIASGYYSSNINKQLDQGNIQILPSNISINPAISINTDGLIIATVNSSVNLSTNINSGYIANQSPTTLSIAGNQILTCQLQSSTIINPNNNIQTIIPTATYITENITINSIPNNYIGTAINQQANTTFIPSQNNQIISSNIFLASDQIIKGDNNLLSDYIKDGTSIFGVTGIYGSENINYENALIEHTLQGIYSNSRITKVRHYGFYRQSQLTSINLPNCSIIGYSAFGRCINLNTVECANCTIVGTSAFDTCQSLVNVSLPLCSQLSNYAFAACSQLTSITFSLCSIIPSGCFSMCEQLSEVHFNNATRIEGNAFYHNIKLRIVDIPLCSYINQNAFSYCISLYSVEFSLCSIIEKSAFYSCSNLQIISAPNCTSIGSFAFYSTRISAAIFPLCSTIGGSAFKGANLTEGISLPELLIVEAHIFYSVKYSGTLFLPKCTQIKAEGLRNMSYVRAISLPMCSFIGNLGFAQDWNLYSLYLMSDSVVILSGSQHFYNTPIESLTGNIYVPNSLLTDYQTDSQWSQYSSILIGV